MIAQVRSLIARLARSRIFRDSSVLLVANWSALALGLATSIVLARVLGADGYGLMVLTMVIVNTIIQFMDIRTDEGLIRFVSNARARDSHREAVTYFYVALSADTLLMMATFGLVVLVGPLATGAYDEAAVLRPLVAIYMFSVPFSALEGTFAALVDTFKRFNLRAAITIVNSLLSLGLLVAAAPYGLTAVMWAQVALSAFSFTLWALVGGALFFRNFPTLKPEGYWQAWRTFIPFAFHTSLTASLKAIATNVDVLVLGALRSPSEVSFYKIARSAADLIRMPTAPVNMVIYPELNEAWARNQLGRVRNLVRRYALATLVIGGACYAFLFVLADWLVWIFYGTEYMPVANLIRILGIGVILDSMFRWVRPATMAAGKPQLATFYTVASTLLRFVLAVLLIFLFGAAGAAWALNLVVILTTLIMIVYVLPRLDLWRPFWQRKAVED